MPTKNEEETILITTSPSETFIFTKEMLQIYIDIAHKYVKDFEHMEMVLVRIPTKDLHKLQISVVHEVQSRSKMKEIDLETSKEGKEVIETFLKETKIESEEYK
jgi:hypothetical protein